MGEPGRAREPAAPAVVRRRREPWLVRLHVVEEEEDRAAGGRAVEPRERRGVDLVRAAEGLEAEARGELLREVDHVRADVEEEARGVVVVPEALRHAEAAVEVGEVGGEGGGAVAAVAQRLGQRHPLLGKRKGDPPMAVDRPAGQEAAGEMGAVAARVHAGEQRRVGRQGPGGRRVRLREQERVGGEGRQVGRRLAPVAVGREVIGPRGVEGHEDHVGRPGRRRERGRDRIFERCAGERVAEERHRERAARDFEPQPHAATRDQEAEGPVGGDAEQRQDGQQDRQAPLAEERAVPHVEPELAEGDGRRRHQRQVDEDEARALLLPGGAGQPHAQGRRGSREDDEEGLGPEARRLIDAEEAVDRREGERERRTVADRRAEPHPGEPGDRDVQRRDPQAHRSRHEAAGRPVEHRLDRPPDRADGGARGEAAAGGSEHAAHSYSPCPKR